MVDVLPGTALFRLPLSPNAREHEGRVGDETVLFLAKHQPCILCRIQVGYGSSTVASFDLDQNHFQKLGPVYQKQFPQGHMGQKSST